VYESVAATSNAPRASPLAAWMTKIVPDRNSSVAAAAAQKENVDDESVCDHPYSRGISGG
jgi:hypothetical protein